MLNLEYLAELTEKSRPGLKARVKEFSIGGRDFDFNSRSAIMGVVNLSPDSWYRESVCLDQKSAIHRSRVLHAQGADFIDIGAESTLDHAGRVNAARQKDKLLPLIKELRRDGLLLSVETYQP